MFCSLIFPKGNLPTFSVLLPSSDPTDTPVMNENFLNILYAYCVYLSFPYLLHDYLGQRSKMWGASHQVEWRNIPGNASGVLGREHRPAPLLAPTLAAGPGCQHCSQGSTPSPTAGSLLPLSAPTPSCGPCLSPLTPVHVPSSVAVDPLPATARVGGMGKGKKGRDPQKFWDH